MRSSILRAFFRHSFVTSLTGRTGQTTVEYILFLGAIVIFGLKTFDIIRFYTLPPEGGCQPESPQIYCRFESTILGPANMQGSFRYFKLHGT